MTPAPSTHLAIWRETSTRNRIVVYADRKVRTLYSHPSNRYPNSDEWPILWRRDVPSLSDAEWIAAPGEGWDHEEAQAGAVQS